MGRGDAGCIGLLPKVRAGVRACPIGGPAGWPALRVFQGRGRSNAAGPYGEVGVVLGDKLGYIAG